MKDVVNKRRKKKQNLLQLIEMNDMKALVEFEQAKYFIST